MIAAHRVGWVFAVLLALSGWLVLLVPLRVAGSACAIPSGLSRRQRPGASPPPGWGVRHGAVARESVC